MTTEGVNALSERWGLHLAGTAFTQEIGDHLPRLEIKEHSEKPDAVWYPQPTRI